MPRARRRFTSSGQPVARRLVVGRAGPVDARRARPNADITTWATPARGRPGAYATHPERRVSPPTAAPRYPASHVRPLAPVGGVALGERRVHPVRPSSPWARGGTTARRAVQVSPWTAVAADSRDFVARPRSAGEIGRGRSSPTRRTSPPPRPAPPRAAPRRPLHAARTPVPIAPYAACLPRVPPAPPSPTRRRLTAGAGRPAPTERRSDERLPAVGAAPRSASSRSAHQRLSAGPMGWVEIAVRSLSGDPVSALDSRARCGGPDPAGLPGRPLPNRGRGTR